MLGEILKVQLAVEDGNRMWHVQNASVHLLFYYVLFNCFWYFAMNTLTGPNYSQT